MNAHPSMKLPYLWMVGPAGFVSTEHVLWVGRYTSAPIRRMADEARLEGRLVDLTFGKPRRWVIGLLGGFLVLSTEPVPVAINEDAPDEFYLFGAEERA